MDKKVMAMYEYMHCHFQIPPSLKCFLFRITTFLSVHFSSSSERIIMCICQRVVNVNSLSRWHSFMYGIIPCNNCDSLIRKSLNRNLCTSVNCKFMGYSTVTKGHCIISHVLGNGRIHEFRSTTAASKEENKLDAHSRSDNFLTFLIQFGKRSIEI